MRFIFRTLLFNFVVSGFLFFSPSIPIVNEKICAFTDGFYANFPEESRNNMRATYQTVAPKFTLSTPNDWYWARTKDFGFPLPRGEWNVQAQNGSVILATIGVNVAITESQPLLLPQIAQVILPNFKDDYSLSDFLYAKDYSHTCAGSPHLLAVFRTLAGGFMKAKLPAQFELLYRIEDAGLIILGGKGEQGRFIIQALFDRQPRSYTVLYMTSDEAIFRQAITLLPKAREVVRLTVPELAENARLNDLLVVRTPASEPKL